MGTTYRDADEPRRIGQALIPPHHPHLADVPFVWLFSEKPMRRRNRVILGKTSAVPPLARFLAEQGGDWEGGGPLFQIVISWDSWCALSETQRRALVDHELSHIVEGDDGELTLTDHDVEEFRHIIERHGLWSYGVAEFAETAARQLTLAEAAAPRSLALARELTADGTAELRAVRP